MTDVDEYVAAFDAADGTTYSRRRTGSFCREEAGDGFCGAQLYAVEKRRGLHVLVKGICREGHTFIRAGMSHDELTRDEIYWSDAGWIGEG